MASEESPLLGGPPLPIWKQKAFLYGTHSLQAFGDRLWAFAVPILFINIWPSTLLPSAIFTFSTYLGNFLLMAPLGSWLDRTNRMLVMTTAIWGQCIAQIVNCSILWGMLHLLPGDGELQWTGPLILCFGALLVTAIISQLMGTAATISLERDWLLEIVHDDPDTLADCNVALRRIDLSCAIVAPAAFGLLMQAASFSDGVNSTAVHYGIAVVAIWNALSVVPEYMAARCLYTAYPRLACKASPAPPVPGQGRLQTAIQDWMYFIRHPVFIASLSYCSIYLTVLCDGALMASYLKWSGVPDGMVGASRGMGALCGLAGTVIFPALRRRLGLVPMGMLSVWVFFLLILPAGIVLLLPIATGAANGLWHAYVMLVAVSISRAGLWCFDLSHTQVMQESVEDGRRGIINGCQTGCSQVFMVALAILGMVYSDPNQFAVLACISAGSVLTAAVGWSLWGCFYQNQHKLL